MTRKTKKARNNENDIIYGERARPLKFGFLPSNSDVDLAVEYCVLNIKNYKYNENLAIESR